MVEIYNIVLENRKWLFEFITIPNVKLSINDTYKKVFSLIDSTEPLNDTTIFGD